LKSRHQPYDAVYEQGNERHRANVASDTLRPAIKKANKPRAEKELSPIQQGATNHTLRRTFAAAGEAGASPAYVMAQIKCFVAAYGNKTPPERGF
jgi:hypothetical protein